MMSKDEAWAEYLKQGEACYEAIKKECGSTPKSKREAFVIGFASGSRAAAIALAPHLKRKAKG